MTYSVDDRVKVVRGPLKDSKGVVLDTEQDHNDDILFVQVQFDDGGKPIWVDAVILEKQD